MLIDNEEICWFIGRIQYPLQDCFSFTKHKYLGVFKDFFMVPGKIEIKSEIFPSLIDIRQSYYQLRHFIPDKGATRSQLHK